MNKGKVTKAIMIGVFVPAIAIGIYYGGKWAIKQYNKSKGGKGGDETKGGAESETEDKPTKEKSDNPFKSSQEVKDFQNFANKNGFSLKVDGIWGKNTKAAWGELAVPYAKNKLAVGDSGIIDTLAKNIYNAKGRAKVFMGIPYSGNDDEDVIYASFTSINTMSQLKALKDSFKRQYKVVMWDWLKEFMNESEMNKVKAIIQKYK